MVRTSLRGFREGLWEPGRQGPRAWAGQGLAGAGQLRELSSVLCNDLEGWEVQEGGDICAHMADSL